MTESRARAVADPGPEAAREHVAAAGERGEVCTVFGRCEVEYDGRAASYLGPGDRLVILKPDGSLLVHTDEQRTPVNWQPPGCEHEAAVRDGRLEIVSRRDSPEERIEIRFDAAHRVAALDMADESELELRGSHEDLRERVLSDPDLVEAGFRPLATERDTDAGAIDIYGEDADGDPVAVELKRRRVGPDAVGQLDRYVDALERDLHDGATVRGVLVAPSVTDRAADLLAERGLAFVSLVPDPD
ncbi:MAG: endonuclease NucS [Halobacteriales archaeon]